VVIVVTVVVSVVCSVLTCLAMEAYFSRRAQDQVGENDTGQHRAK